MSQKLPSFLGANIDLCFPILFSRELELKKTGTGLVSLSTFGTFSRENCECENSLNGVHRNGTFDQFKSHHVMALCRMNTYLYVSLFDLLRRIGQKNLCAFAKGNIGNEWVDVSDQMNCFGIVLGLIC